MAIDKPCIATNAERDCLGQFLACDALLRRELLRPCHGTGETVVDFGLFFPCSYGHLPVIAGYKWDYTFYKWGYKYL